MAMTAPQNMTALVLAVGLDDLTLGRVKSALRGTELVLQSVSAETAIQRAEAESGPIIGLLEWTEEHEAQQSRLCEALRRAARPGQCYIVALGGLSDRALARAMEGPANDVLSRPFGGDALLLVRLRQALRTMTSAHAPVTPRDALAEALQSPSGGEIVVRAGDVVGHIHVQNGFIVWANLSSVPATMEEVVRHAGIDPGPEIIAAAKEESRATRAHFMDVLVAWNVIEPDRAKEAVRTFVAARVELVLELPGASALFLPKARQHTEHLRFSAGEIPSVRVPSNGPPRVGTPFPALPPAGQATLPLGKISHLFQQATQLDGVISVAILDRATGASLLLSGAEIDTGVAWSQLTLLAALGARAEDVMGAAGEHCFVARPLRVAPALALFVVLSQATTNLGLARSMVARIAGTAYSIAPPPGA
jgi:CheY-like chemotaxis protein